MASYNTIRTAESQPIGSVVPWVGSLTKVPEGWLICNGQQFLAKDYPLLARILKNTYGGDGFGGVFPNYTGYFELPSLSQKGLSDISTEYFTDETVTPGADQPTLNIDTPEALPIISPYIGAEGDLGTPGTVFAITDLDMTYQPDPDGTLLRITYTGVAATTTTPQIWTNVTQDSNQPPASGGTDATFTVVQNTNSTYSVAVSAKGSGYAIDDIIIIPGSSVGGVAGVNDITVTVTAVGDPFFRGNIDGGGGADLSFVPGFGITPVYVVPRKLGRGHFPSHIHPGTYRTTSTSDSGSEPGRGVGVWENPEILILEAWYGLFPLGGPECPVISFGCRSRMPIEYMKMANIWDNEESPYAITTVINPFSPGVGRYSLASIIGTPPARTHRPISTATDKHGVGKTWFTNAPKLRDGLGNTSPTDASLEKIRTTGRFDATSRIPFSDSTDQVGVPNYDLGVGSNGGSDNSVEVKEVFLNSAATEYNKLTRENIAYNDVITPHDHQGDFNVQFDNGSLSIPGFVEALVEPNVIPDSVPNAFQITFTCTSPSLSIINLIRAY